MDLRNKELEDRDLEVITKLNKIEKLYLGNNKLTNDALKNVTHLKGLTYISIAMNEEITDDGVEYLVSFPKLRRVDLRETGITAAGLKRIREVHPNVTFYVDALEMAGLAPLRKLGGTHAAKEGESMAAQARQELAGSTAG